MFPALAGHMRPSDPARSINGMFSFTPDAGSIVGESAAVRGLWVCEAVWVTHAGGMAQQAVEWMVDGEPSYDLAEADANRFYPFQTSPPYVLERGKQQYREVYDIIHPLQQLAKPRETCGSHRSSSGIGRSVRSSSPAPGWERPQWFARQRDARGRRHARVGTTRGLGGAADGRPRWAPSTWPPVERAALFDITPFAKFDVDGPDALRLPRAGVRQPDRPARWARSCTRRC